MKTVNRSAFVVRFKEPYIQWASGLDLADSDIADEAMWPAARDLDTFRAWFDVVGESVVIDLAPGKLRTEEL